MARQSFIKGALILLGAGIFNRILGFVPRIALPRIVGAEGVGLYQMGYPFLIVVLTIITGGIPLAVAKLVAEARGDVRKARAVLRIALSITVTLGALFTLLSIVLAKWIVTRLFTDERVYLTFIAMSPIILMAGVSAVLRGYFQGLHNMIPTAFSQMTETLLRIAAVLTLAWLLLPYGLQFAAAGAMAGVAVGELGGLVVLLGQFAAEKRKKAPPSRSRASASGLFRRLMAVSVPVTASRLVGSGSYFLESILIVQSLAAAGVMTAVATAQYGALQGMVIPILLLPTALTYSLAVSLVPSLSEAAERRDLGTVSKRMRQSLRLALVTGGPFAALIYVLAEPLCLFVYKDPQAGAMLRAMAPAALFIYVQGPLQAALQALDKPGAALRNTFIGACVKLGLIAILASNPSYGIIGAIAAINVNIMLVTVLHWFSIGQLVKFPLTASEILKFAAALALSGLIALFLWDHPLHDHQAARLAAAMTGGFAAYLLCAFGLGLIDRRDALRMMRLGKKFVKG